jgi:5-methylcytosine-specific restriction endonuclease McrA
MRRAIPKAIKSAVLIRSGGICEADGCDNHGAEFEHRIPVALGGENTEANIWWACKSCHRDKTSGEDIPRIAKAKRQARETGRQREDKKRRAWPSRPIQSRGFTKAKPQNSATRPLEKRT